MLADVGIKSIHIINVYLYHKWSFPYLYTDISTVSMTCAGSDFIKPNQLDPCKDHLENFAAQNAAAGNPNDKDFCSSDIVDFMIFSVHS